MSLESQLQARLLLAAPARLPQWRMFRRNVGEAKLRGGHTVHFGIKGQADIYAMLRGGRHVEIELKAAGKQLSPEQKQWQVWCLEWEVPHVVLRALKSESEEETVERWITELSSLIAADAAPP